MTFGAVILAGGRASRLSGVDKVVLEVGGRSLLARSLDAVAGAESVVVVGPRRALPGVVWVREDPPHSGPLAALAAGLAALPDTGEVALLAGDLLGVSAATVHRLRSALGSDAGAAGAVLVDDTGQRQWLIGVWRVAALRAVLPADPAGRSLRAVLGGLPLVEVTAEPGESADVDTSDDLPSSG